MIFGKKTPKTEVDGVTDTWQLYQKGLEYLNKINLFNRVETAYRFIEGDQWHGLESGGERMPQLNFLKPIMKYAVAIVAQNGTTINYSPIGRSRSEVADQACQQLNRYAARQWEQLKLDRKTWDVIQNAYIAGDAFLYFYDAEGELKMEMIDTNNVMLADEQNPDVQEQPYILMIQRRYVTDIKKEAKANGLSDADIDLIVADQDDDTSVSDVDEVDNNKKCISIAKLWKDDDCVWISRSTKTVQYQPDTCISGLKLYPIAHYGWQRKQGCARGWGDVWDKIPNQVEVNKALARMCIASKEFSFPHIVYNRDKLSVEDVNNLSVIGSKIGISSYEGQKLSDIVGYMQASNISPIAPQMLSDLMNQTRDLAGASDSVTGQINPEKASGAAIIAVRDAAALPLNMQAAAYKQFVEDVASIWYALWVAYHPNGLDVPADDEEEEFVIPGEVLEEMRVFVRIDVSPTNPYSKFAQEQGLQNLLTAGYITFDEYVDALDDDSTVPKGKLEDILESRQAAQAPQMEQLMTENAQLKEQLATVPGQIEQAVNVGMDKQAEQERKQAEIAQLMKLAEGGASGGKEMPEMRR